ncbi:hypothetical protein A3C91_03740 [Candidatus Azambacteria bacterium RIFCSPHIGHO2_02_FULL_52_12]|uniref:Uncharacterized protein n=1 Tax=Candidatus Azambacteria bacterium RIFCSPLOWO2_01_FULL_46_25 TaxID=1797298 RepID=A0A1F5BUX3_9BACT|nr:MAG: hypothetical protein A3C91_03740 [Candidatus Azambacteria bacterium RIFCSPHIGHO2_02_FULL_52_12]OGD34358.1 MAG: hypothetical protein A2988_02410 [Candidatus Azambacteria bacterium RIFCSPLOWO2_01_FULL_46_25]OGD37364.1 MAG: hypothetical protein A2850_01475 [Candidatus Azambacteria bacterium RIFCSPHIGHO2_01_FULL_51_74]
MANGFLPKPISGLLIAVMIANSVLFAMMFQPQPAQATGLPVVDIASIAQSVAKFVWDAAKFVYEKAVDIKNAAFQYWEQFKSNHGVIAEIVSSLLLIAMHQALAKLTNDIVAWINGGGKGKIRVLQDPGKFLADAADEAGGILAGQILGVDPKSLCNADYLKYTLAAELTGPYSVPTFPEKVTCTFSGMADGLRKFQEDFRYGGWASFVQLLEKPNNQIGQKLLAMDELNRIEATKTQEAQAELATMKSGFLNQKRCFITKAPTSGRFTFDQNELAQSNLGGGLASQRYNIEGRDLEDAMKLFGDNFVRNEEEFKAFIIREGGMVECKTVTPGEQISNLANKALLAPYERLEQSITGLTDKLGTGAGSVIKPYVLAISSALINQMLKKEKGLISGVLTSALQKRDRRLQRQPSDSLQNNAQLAQSAGALSGSVNDFRSFLIKSLIEFNLFVTTASNIINASDDVFGKVPIDSSTVTTGWPGGLDANGGGMERFGPGNQLQPYVSWYKGKTEDINPLNDADGKSYRNVMTNYPGKVFYQETQWCGAYSEEIPIEQTSTIETLATGAVANAIYAGPAGGNILSYRDGTDATTPPPTENWMQFATAQTTPVQSTCPDGYYMSGLNNDGSDNNGNHWRLASVYCDHTPWNSSFFANDNATVIPVPLNGESHCPSGTYMSGYKIGGAIAPTPAFGPPGDFKATAIICSGAPAGLPFNRTNESALSPPTNLRIGQAGVSYWDPRICPNGKYMSGIRIDDMGVDAMNTTVFCSDAPAFTGTHITETFWEQYLSPTFDGGSVSLANKREQFIPDPAYQSILPPIDFVSPSAATALLGRGKFFPELVEKIQELMEKIRIITGYHFGYPSPDVKDYTSALADQLGTNPDDDPKDNDRKDTAGAIIYEGSVTDVLTKYGDLAQIYQQLFAGLQDENSLEGVDKDFKILSPEENNIRLALIGKRCPILPPSPDSSLYAECPRLPSGEYNMARKFIFEKDAASGITTGFATNPFTGEKSSSLAGLLNLEEMAAQLGSLPPDKNIIKLIRIRQLLEQLQVWRSMNPIDTPNYRKALGEIKIPNKTTLSIPDALTGVDTVLVSLSGYEKIQDWLNATSTTDSLGAIVPVKNQDIQTLIEAYGYTTAKEAYPQISKELDGVLDDIINQITDKLKDVFLKRTELALEQARKDARHRLEKFIIYVRDLGSEVKLEIPPSEAAVLQSLGFATQQIERDAFVLKVDAGTYRASLAPPAAGASPVTPPDLKQLTDFQKNGLIGSAQYKIRALARFLSIDVTAKPFRDLMEGYATYALDIQLQKALEDAYKYYTGVTDAGNPSAGILLTDGSPLYKDAQMKLEELKNDFNLMLEETRKVKEEFQQLNSDVGQQKQGLQDMLDNLNIMASDYAQANACFNVSTLPNSRWNVPPFLSGKYNGAAGTAIVSGGVAAGTTYGALIATGVTSGAVLGAATLGVGLVVVAAVAYFSSRKAKKKQRAAEQAYLNALRKCAEGIDDYNRHLGQLVDNFVCGKINKKYEDKF